jgi:hypothetical protein
LKDCLDFVTPHLLKELEVKYLISIFIVDKVVMVGIEVVIEVVEGIAVIVVVVVALIELVVVAIM